MQNAYGKNPSFPWCTWQPKATLSIPFHQPTGLQHGACWIFSEQTVLSSVCVIFSSTVRLWVSWQDCKKSVILYLCPVLGMLICTRTFTLWISSLFLIMPSMTQQLPTCDFATKSKNLLLIDLIEIFYQFHHVPSYVPRLCPHAESSCNVPVEHLPQQYLRKG